MVKRLAVVDKAQKVQAYTWLAAFQVVPVWIFDILYADVWQHGFSDISGGGRCLVIAGGNQTVLDFAGAMGLDIYCRYSGRLGGTVQLWFLWIHADSPNTGTDCHGAVQAPYMVFLLPGGNYDTGDLQAEKRKNFKKVLTFTN